MPLELDYPVPESNFRGGLVSLDLPEMVDQRLRPGKTSEMYDVRGNLLTVRLDTQSSNDFVVGATPGKGGIISTISVFSKLAVADIMQNDFVDQPHPYVTISKKASLAERPLVEIVWRDCVAVTKTDTSLWRNRNIEGKKDIYGYHFEEEFEPWQQLPEPLLTPTTKALKGHDEMLTVDEARKLVDTQFNRGRWDEIVEKTGAVFEWAKAQAQRGNKKLLDLKFEVAIIDGEVVLIDEVLGPDSIRMCDQEGFEELRWTEDGPPTGDKEYLRKFLSDPKPKGLGWNHKTEPVPVIPRRVRYELAARYRNTFEAFTGQEAPNTPRDVRQLHRDIRRVVLASR